jgi:hypothetical protein
LGAVDQGDGGSAKGHKGLPPAKRAAHLKRSVFVKFRSFDAASLITFLLRPRAEKLATSGTFATSFLFKSEPA